MNKTEIFKNKLADSGFDALLVTSEVNQYYVTGFYYQDGYAVVTKKGVYLITDFRYIEAAEAEANEGVKVMMPGKDETALGLIKGIVESDGAKTVAVEDATLALSWFDRIKKALADSCELVFGASELLDNMRTVKTAEELECIKKAQSITDAAFTHILNFITPDKTEIEVALELEFFMRRNGAEGLAFETIAVSGSASSQPHGVPRPVKLEKGFLTMDYGAKVNGYCSDMTRTVVIGRADDEMKRLYNAVLEAQLAGLAAAKKGVLCADVDKVARDIINNAGYEGCFGHGLGHGVGMYIHEAPRVSYVSKATLEVGNVVTVEPGIYLSGKYGCRIEDMIAITEDGIYDFTQSPKELIEIV